MKILLIQSFLGKSGEIPLTFPLGLACLYGILKEHECTILDPNIVEQPFNSIQNSIEKTNPEIVGVSLRNIDSAQSNDPISFLPYFFLLLKFIKRMKPDAKVVVGGTGFSIFPEEIMALCPEIDYGLYLESEFTFPSLLRNLENPEKVKGVFFRRNGTLTYTGRPDYVNIDLLEETPRDALGLDLEYYLKTHYSIGIQTKRGCAFRCAYCIYPHLQGKNVRLRSAKKVVDEIQKLEESYGVKDIFFADTIFNYPLDHARSICKEMKKRRLSIKWRAWFREDFMNQKFMTEARDSGCECFEFSPDGGSPHALGILQKDIRIEDIKRTCQIASETEGVKAIYNFTYNVPDESIQTVEHFYRLVSWIMAKNMKKHQFPGVVFTNIRIYPHTRIFENAIEEGYIRRGQDLLYPTFYNPLPFRLAYLPLSWAYASGTRAVFQEAKRVLGRT